MNEDEIYTNQFNELCELNLLQKEMGLNILDVNLLSNDLIGNEKKLHKLNNYIRREWLKKAGINSSKIYKSTILGTSATDLKDYRYQYSYETLLNDDNEFSKLLGYSVTGMNETTFLFPSGMTAITSLFYCLSSFIKGSLDIQASIGYYETKYFLNIMKSMGNEVVFELMPYTNSNVFYFEPIKYDTTLSITEVHSLVEAINTSKANLKFVIMDSTMHNKTKIIKRLQNKIEDNSNIIFFDVRSGLKLDQEGLELSNLGICTVFVTKQNPILFRIIAKYIKEYKNFTGTNLSFYSLNASHYFNISKSEEYTRKVRNQIIWAIKKINIKSSTKIKSLVWRNTKFLNETLTVPFIFLELGNNDKETYLNAIQVLLKSMKKKGLSLDYRNSWGFRFPSIEFFNDIFTNKKYIKYYPGSFEGLTANEAINSLNNL